MKPSWNTTSTKVLLICRKCGIKYSAFGNHMTSSIEVDAETMAEVDTISLVKECPDCWDPELRNK